MSSPLSWNPHSLRYSAMLSIETFASREFWYIDVDITHSDVLDIKCENDGWLLRRARCWHKPWALLSHPRSFSVAGGLNHISFFTYLGLRTSWSSEFHGGWRSKVAAEAPWPSSLTACLCHRTHQVSPGWGSTTPRCRVTVFIGHVMSPTWYLTGAAQLSLNIIYSI